MQIEIHIWSNVIILIDNRNCNSVSLGGSHNIHIVYAFTKNNTYILYLKYPHVLKTV